jgi:hypothetical protein
LDGGGRLARPLRHITKLGPGLPILQRLLIIYQ